jgi:hypothetical protein
MYRLILNPDTVTGQPGKNKRIPLRPAAGAFVNPQNKAILSYQSYRKQEYS